MSLKKYIQNELPKEEQENLFATIKKWLGNVDLEYDMEKNIMYKTVIIGAINLMRHMAFEWIKPNESSVNIGNRWHELHLKNKNSLSYGIRFSTSEPKMITLGFLYTFFDKEEKTPISDYFVRYEILDDFMFKEKKSINAYSFSSLLQIAIDHINKNILRTFGGIKRCDQFEYHQMKPLNLNKFPLVMEKLDFYITSNHLTMNGYTIYLDDEEQNDNVFYLKEPSTKQIESSTKKTLKQGCKVWSFSKE